MYFIWTEKSPTSILSYQLNTQDLPNELVLLDNLTELKIDSNPMKNIPGTFLPSGHL